jgi:hypothetical protein
MNWNKWIDYFFYWFPIIYCPMLAIYVTFLSLHGNPLFWRQTPTSGHTLVWISILLFATYIRYRIKRNNHIKWMFSLLLILALIELPWQIAYFFSTQNTNKLSVLSHTWSSLTLIFGFIGCASLIRADKMFDKRRFLRAFLYYAVFFVVWYFNGFHITVDSSLTNPLTVYYHDVFTNSIEIMQWWFGLIIFGLSFRGER